MGSHLQERGQILVLFAITAAAMLALIGVLYSFGVILSQRRALQTAADSASLSGTWQVLSELGSDNRSDADVLATVLKYAGANGAAAGSVSALYVDAAGAQVGTSNVGQFGAAQFPVEARGVRVRVDGQVSTVLPGFLSVFQVLVQDSASAAARPTLPPATASAVIPVAISRSAYAAHATYDLFAHPPTGSPWATLDFSSNGAPTFGPMSSNEQFWSDGQHTSGWLLGQPASVRLADAAYYDSIAAGLRDNIRRQALGVDRDGNAYGLVIAPVYDPSRSSGGSVYVVGFVQLKIVSASLTLTSAPALFVPYAAAPYGAPQAPAPDLGATVVGLTS